MSNQTQMTVDFRAIALVTYWYVNWCGQTRKHLPKIATFNNQSLTKEEVDTLLKLRLDLDVWTPMCRFHRRSGGDLYFKGDKAKKMWAAYNKHIYTK